MTLYNAKIVEVDFFGNEVGEPLKMVSGEFDTVEDALKKFTEDYAVIGNPLNINFKVEIID